MLLLEPMNDPAGDDAPRIQKALDAIAGTGSELVLATGKWYCKSAIIPTGHSVRMRGEVTGLSPYDYGAGGRMGTQLIGVNGLDCISPTNIGYFALEAMDIWLPIGATTACKAVKLDQCFNPKIKDIRTTNYSTGIALTRNSDVTIEGCYFSSVGVTVATVNGVDIDGGAHAQNASVIFDKCISAHGGYTGTAYGYNLHGNRVNDTTLTKCEAAGGTIGFLIDGGAGIDAGYAADIRLDGCVADNCSTYSYQVNAINSDGMVNITGGWAGGPASTHMYISGSRDVNISNMQIFAGGNGVYFTGGSSGIAHGNLFKYQTGNSIVMDGASGCIITSNKGYTKTGATTACFIHALNNGINNIIANNYAGGIAGGYGTGVWLEPGSDYSVVEGNIMPAAAITTPYALNAGTNIHNQVSGNI